jgi:hypothetical protein
MLHPSETGARLQEQGPPHLCDHPVAAAQQLGYLARDGIHECTISLLGFLPAFLSFYKMLFMNKLEYYSLITGNFVVQISETIGEVWLSVRFSSF